jgi:hypothetical protein
MPGKLTRTLSIALVATVVFFISCRKGLISTPFATTPANITNGFVINGDGYDSRLFVLNNINSNSGSYDTSSHRTNVSAEGDTANLHVKIILNFGGNVASGLPSKIISPDSIRIMISDITNPKLDSYASIPKKTTLFINTYENVNGRIMGSFSGPFVNLSNMTDTVQVTNGRFSVLRQADVH